MERTTLEVRHLTDRTALYCKYQGQTQAQGCLVILDCDHGTLTAEYDPEVGGAIPMNAAHNRMLRWCIPCLKADAANDLLDKVAPLAQKVLDGYSVEWNGHNHVGRFTVTAEETCHDIEWLVEEVKDDQDLCVNAWSAEDYLSPLGSETAQAKALSITAETTDEQLEALEADIVKNATNDGVDILTGISAHLESLRDGLCKG